MTSCNGFTRMFGNTGDAFMLGIGLFGFSLTRGPTTADLRNAIVTAAKSFSRPF